MEVKEIKDSTIVFLNHQIETGFEGHPSKLYGFSGVRTPGFHLSDVTQDLYMRLNKPKRREKGAGPEGIWTIGLAWEHVLSWGWSQVFPDHPERIVHLGEFEQDGIIMTPDRVDSVWPGVVEMKATFKRADKWPIQEQWLWLVQGKAYCHVLGLEQCRWYVLHIMDAMGMYTGEIIAPKVWEVRFTHGELVRNWEMILQHRDNMAKGGKG